MVFTKYAYILMLFFFVSCTFAKGEKDNMSDLRKNMVKTQIIARGVKDKKVLAALEKVKRHLFVPEQSQDAAYNDYPLSIGHEQTISQPYIVALMTELLKIKANDKVLEIGTGSGYQAAVLGELAKEVYTVEIVKPLADRSKKLLKKLEYKNIKVKHGDGFKGWEKYAPFDKIIVTCAPDKIPTELVNQLKNGGLMVIPVGDYYQTLKVISKQKNKIKEKDIIAVRFVPMVKE